MSKGFLRPLHDFWLPAGIAVLGILVSFTFWGLLVLERRGQIQEATERMAHEAGAFVEGRLERQHQALTGLAGLWGEFGLGTEAAWHEDARQRIEHTPGLVALAWVSGDGVRRRAARAEGVPPAVLGDLGAVAGASAARASTGPERLPSGEIGVRVVVPVAPPGAGSEGADAAWNGRERGSLVAVFRLEPLLASLIEEEAEPFAAVVRTGDRTLYARGTPSSDPWQDWWRAEATVVPPWSGEAWTLSFRPTPALAAARLTPLPHYLLATGLVLAMVMALAVYQLQVISRQSRRLAAANRALERRRDELGSEVEARTAELREAVAELEAFNYSVSHDLRSPLGAILNFVAILEEDYRERPLDEDGRRYLGRIRRSATRATDLLEDLLQLSRAGRATLRREPVDMTALANETFAQVRAAEDDFDVEFLLETLPEAEGDRALLANVFANLFSNALKYSRGAEKRRVGVTGRREGDECVYVVTDNGMGFDMRFAEKLFGLFERLHHDETIEGTGIGLAMVVRIVKRHGGRVWAEGRPGEGASFSFALPRRPA